MLAVADAEDDQRGQPIGIAPYGAGVDTLAFELLRDEAAHVIGAHTRDDGALEPEPGKADRRIGGTAADIFGERAHILEPPADLLAVEVDA